MSNNNSNENHESVNGENLDVNKVEEKVLPTKKDVNKKFEMLMQDQDEKQAEFENKKGGPISIDDSHDRTERSAKIAAEGKRKGKKFAPNKGTASFMSTQNAKYKASGRPAPYSNECIKNTLMREEGILQGKA